MYRLHTATSWLGSFAILIGFQLLGTVVVTVTGVPLPAPVAGLVLLGIALVAGHHGRVWRHRQVATAADPLLEILPLLFVPAGVGVVTYLPLINQYLFAVILALVLSFVVTLFTTGGLLELFLRKRGRRR